MNLVQINERLKDLPMQVLQQYANGMNPEVPPYLALGELQRREMSQKQAATAQGAAQGPQPSVKEQVEQKAGLMALQQMQQQQMAQQMQQPRGPMPVPPGAPQPEAQPQPEMMARGGLAGIPVRRDMFEYAGGGIIAFQSGGQPKKYETRYDKMNRENRERAAQDEPRVINLPPGTPAQEVEMIRLQNPDAIVQTGEEGNKIQALMDKIKGAATYSSDVEAMKQRERIASAPSGSVSEAQASAMAGPQAQMPAGLPAALQKAGPAAAPARPPATPAAPMAGAPMPGAPRPTPAQVGAPAAPQAGLPAALAGAPEFSATPVSPRIAQVDEMMASQKRAAPTAQGVIEGVNALLPEGMQDEATKKRFAEQRARAEAGKAAYEKSQPTGLDNLIRVLGQAGQYKGFSGIGPAYTANQQQRRAEDLAFQRQQDELMTAIEGRERSADEKMFGARSTAMDRAQQSFSDSEKAILTAAVKQAEMEQGRLSDDNKAKMALDLKRWEQAQEEKLKRMEFESQEKRVKWQLANQNIIEKQGLEYVNLLAQARAERAKGTPQSIARANELDARAKNIETVIVRGGAGGAGAGPKAMTRDQATDNVNKILENPMMSRGFIADAKAGLAARGVANPTMIQIQEYLIQEQMRGADLAAPPQTGKVPPPPPGFKLN